MLSVAIPVVLALIAIEFELINNSAYRRERTREKERRHILALMMQIKGMSADPDVNDYYKRVKAAIEDRRKK